jgi:hypothetical protein
MRSSLLASALRTSGRSSAEGSVFVARAARLVAAAALTTTLAACSDTFPGAHAPRSIRIVSGSGQSGDVSAPLDSALVVEVVDANGAGVPGVALTWTALGGGSVSETSTTTDGSGKSSVTWTLAPTIANQAVNVTSGAVQGVSATFLANNGGTISGTVTTTDALSFAPVFSRTAARAGLSSATAPSVAHLRRSNQILVGFKSGAMGLSAAASSAYRSVSAARTASASMQSRLDAVLAGRGVREMRISPAILAARITVADSSQVDETIRMLAANPDIAYAQRNPVISIRNGAPHATVADRALIGADRGLAAQPAAQATATRLPNDANYFLQTWSANMLDLPKAWAITTGSSAVTVAVVDMGVRFTHPSMGNLTSDGYDFVTPFTLATPEKFCDGVTMLTSTEGDGDGPDADPTDPDDIEFDSFRGCWFHNPSGDHGLWTAGIIGAVGNQRIGIAGVNWNVKLRPIRVLDITGSGDFFDIAQGILYAAGLPAVGAGGVMVQTTAAPIINVSLGGPDDVPTLADAVAAAQQAGSLIVASAGNDGLDDVVANYPASYPGVMSVSAVGMDGMLATYSNGGTRVSVAAPGGDFRFDDNGGGGVLGPGWNFVANAPNLIFGYGTSAAAPFVSGIAALLLAQTPGLTAAQLRSRIETFATRPPNALRSDAYGWGIVNAYNSLTQQNGPARKRIVRLLNATTGDVVATRAVDGSGNFAFAKLDSGAYVLQAGEDEAGDGTIGLPGRRFTWAGGFGAPRLFNIDKGNGFTAAIVLGQPLESEPNDDVAHANRLSVNSYVIGSITPPDTRDMYTVMIPAAGTYLIETSGVLGTCGWGIELDTFISVETSTGALAGLSDNFASATSDNCSQVRQTLQPGSYRITVVGTGASGLASHGRYRLEVRAIP